jgi:ribonucleoside-diphosphate reductase alpha chain
MGDASPTGFGAAGFGATALAGLTPAQPADLRQPDSTAPSSGSGDQPKASSVAGTSLKEGEPAAQQSIDAKTGGATAPDANTSAAAASNSGGSSSSARDELAVVASNGHANGNVVAKATNGSGLGTVTLSLGATNVAFKIQEDAPSCAECGSIMVRNGSCYKCLNCGSTSGCS